jgi:hypothetical protein
LEGGRMLASCGRGNAVEALFKRTPFNNKAHQ